MESQPDGFYWRVWLYWSQPNARKYVGEYVPDKNRKNFYPVAGLKGKTTTGVICSNVRIERWATVSNPVIAETFTIHEGKYQGDDTALVVIDFQVKSSASCQMKHLGVMAKSDPGPT